MRIRRISFALAFATLAYLAAFPQIAGAQTPAASPATSVYAIKGAKVYTISGAPIENGIVVIRDGKIAAVGANVAIPSDAQVIDATGLELYPGLFDPVTQIGLNEISQVSATMDVDELGDYNPELVAATAVNPASAHIAVTRANGITHVIAAPGTAGFDASGGGLITGQASAFNLAGWTMNDMQINRSVAMVINWPSIQTRTFDFATFSFKEKSFDDAKKEYDKSVNELSDWLDRARHYAQAKEKGSPALYERDIKLEALVPVVEGKLPVLVIADDHRDIKNAVDFCTKQNLKMILGSGAEAWRVKDLLKEKKIPVILGPTERLPEQEDTPVRQAHDAALGAACCGHSVCVFEFRHGVLATSAGLRGHGRRVRPAARRGAQGGDNQRREDVRDRRRGWNDRNGQTRQLDRDQRRPTGSADPGEVPLHKRTAYQPRQPTPRTLRAVPEASESREVNIQGNASFRPGRGVTLSIWRDSTPVRRRVRISHPQLSLRFPPTPSKHARSWCAKRSQGVRTYYCRTFCRPPKIQM